jgi:plastocyanin
MISALERARMRRLAALLFLSLIPLRAVAGDVVVNVRTSDGRPVVNAAVTIAAPHSGPIRFPWAYSMAQQNLQFDPFVLIVPLGADVAFPNLDKVRHHVYSFSPAKTFELKLYGHDETRVVNFDKLGVVPLGCNIHDSMVAFVVVVDTPYATKTDASGQAMIHDVPAGAQTVRVWHPYLRAPGNALTLPVTVAENGEARVQFTGDLWAPVAPHRLY